MGAEKISRPVSADVRREVMEHVGRSALHEFNVAFLLMGLIPLIIGAYILAARLFTINVFEGLNGLYFLLAIIITVLGFFAGRRIIRHILQKLIDANVEVRQHEVMKTAFIANVAYELRPPLAAAQLSLKNLDDGLLGPMADLQRHTVQECSSVVGRLVRMTTDLIDLTGMGSGSSDLQLDVCTLQDILREVVQVASPYLEPHQLRIEEHLPRDPVLFYGDRNKLVQAFGSLLDHAVRWSSEGSAVRLTMESQVADEWRVIVAHDIAGHQADFARALDTFTRLGGNVEDHLGLGLRLAKEVAQRHQGRLWVEGEPGRNSRLIMTLPSLQRQRHLSERVPSSPSASGA